MTPVELRLQNFLSYGEAAPVLDFEAFSVACISGGNGQGKSSLLEAITWALWGQARKGASATKPDADLIRKGTQRMLVEFTFDHEGERYRVRRAYNVSGSGKTSRPELELLVRDEATYRPLTGPSVSETQKTLDRLLRLDFDTFVNASFLIQGRSDEFTRKKATERKEVLARILDLGRYEVLEERARVREGAAKAAYDLAERDLARIGADLATRADVEAGLATAREAEAVARATREAEESRCQVARRALDALTAEAQRADDLRARLARLDAERVRTEAERAQVDARIAAAEALLERRGELEAARARYDALDAERRTLAEQSAQHLGLKQQELALDADLQRRTAEHDRQRTRLEAERSTEAQRLADLDAARATRPALLAERAAARTAGHDFAALDATRTRLRVLHDEQRSLQADLDSARRALDAERARAERLAEEAAARAARRRRVDAEADALRDRAQQADAARQHLALLHTQGLEQGDLVRRLKLDAEHAQAALDTLRTRLDRLETAEAGACPVCGTDLTPDHRAHAAADLQAQGAEAEAELRERARTIDAEERTLGRLRADYTAQRSVSAERANDEEAFQRLNRELRDTEGAEAEAQAAAHAAETLRARLRAGDVAPDVRARLAEIAADLAVSSFDAARYEALRADAARLDALDHRIADLDRRLAETDELRGRLQRLDARLDDLRRQHDDGRLFGDVLARRDRIRARLDALGFDGARFEAVEAEHARLRDVPEQVAALLAAREQRADHLARRAALTEALARHASEADALARDLSALDALAVRRAEARTHLDAAEADLARATAVHEGARDEVARLGLRAQQLAALAAHAADAEAEALRARDEAALYRHLRTAFSSRGIPSLIIEETLPEIEEMANDLLGRLTDGRMHLQLRTLRDKKTGGTAETLDIVLSDESGGERPYETFSGGEAFRVNFALRVALSQLLARRSGVAVRTLVIDEGFGTQDVQGLQALVEAIRHVQDHFDKILVVTHLDELKEAFPVRIEVRKDPTLGSTFEVIGV